MGKDQIFSGQPVFSQLLALVGRTRVNRLARRHDSDRYYKYFKTYDHLVTMLYAILHRCTSLREVTTGLQVCQFRVNHLGLDRCPRRSTISDANRARTAEVFEAIYQSLYQEYRSLLPDSLPGKGKWLKRLYIIDSTTISLFKEILKNVGPPVVNGKRKGGIKVHTLMKADEDVPCFVRMTAAVCNDIPFMRELRLPKGSIVTFDKGYYSYRQFHAWTQEGIGWVTRLRERSQYTVIEELAVCQTQADAGVLRDARVLLGNRKNPGTLTRLDARLVTYHDAASGNTFEFITNQMQFEPATIAQIYQRRWQIEILFKRIKQNAPLRYFLGDNENAIRIQIWCALIADLLLKIVMATLKRPWSFGNLSSMIRIHLMSYVPLFRFLNDPDTLLINSIECGRPRGPTLFD